MHSIVVLSIFQKLFNLCHLLSRWYRLQVLEVFSLRGFSPFEMGLRYGRNKLHIQPQKQPWWPRIHHIYLTRHLLTHLLLL